ncbi:Panacea domain-containing protein [Mucilaginibacter gynuensis]|uniref:Panacea domain-containing protein n=1 Tax=Mucilaginibacter gynuensis TaxID=1302236 RepID=A0ABP8GPC5_9SPHI
MNLSTQISPISISNFFVNKAISEGVELTPMKLLKLVYLAHGWHLGLNNATPLISEAVQAWKFGPVINSVYHDFKSFKDSQITSLGFDPTTLTYPILSDTQKTPLLLKVWDVYKNWTGLELSALTHEDGSPWDTVWNKQGGKNKQGAIIPNDLIADYYMKKSGKSNG